MNKVLIKPQQTEAGTHHTLPKRTFPASADQLANSSVVILPVTLFAFEITIVLYGSKHLSEDLQIPFSFSRTLADLLILPPAAAFSISVYLSYYLFCSSRQRNDILSINRFTKIRRFMGMPFLYRSTFLIPGSVQKRDPDFLKPPNIKPERTQRPFGLKLCQLGLSGLRSGSAIDVSLDRYQMKVLSMQSDLSALDRFDPLLVNCGLSKDLFPGMAQKKSDLFCLKA